MENKELELLEKISGKQDLNAKEVKEIKEANAEVKKKAEDLSLEVAALTKDVALKGATIEQMVTEQKELKAKSGRFQAAPSRPIEIKQAICDLIGEKKDDIISLKLLNNPVEVKTVGPILSANNSANYLSYLDFRPGMEPTGQFHFRSLVNTIQSATDYVQFPRANTPIGEGSFARTADGNTKPQVDRDYTMVDLTLNAMAGFAIVSRQALRNIIFLQSWLPTSMMNSLEESEDTDFSNTLVAGATGSSTTSGITVNVERLIYFIKNLQVAKYRATAIALDPTIWASILVTKPSNYSLPNVVTIDPSSGMVRIIGVPVYPVNWLTGGRCVVGDFSKTAIVQSEGLTLRQSDSHASIFTANELAFLLERTENLAIFRPDAFITALLT